MKKSTEFKSVKKFVNENHNLELFRTSKNYIVIRSLNGHNITVKNEGGLFPFTLVIIDNNDLPMHNRGYKTQGDMIKYLAKAYE